MRQALKSARRTRAANINAKAQSFRTLAWYGYINITSDLIQQGAGADLVESEGRPALRVPCFGHAETIRLLITAGADAGCRDPEGESTADLARKQGRLDVVEPPSLGDEGD